MSEVAAVPATPAGPPTAGRLLREARERQGLHIAALSASIKVAQKKLEMLEADRFDGLPDATFTRALAQTVCRALKIDQAPIMALLPPPAGYRLEQVGEGLNAPFRNRPSALAQPEWGSFARRPAFWLPVLAVFLLPKGLLGALPWRAGSAPSPVVVVPITSDNARALETPGMPPPGAPTVNEAPGASVEPAVAASAASSVAAPLR